MEIQSNLKIAEAAVAFQKLPAVTQDAIIETLKLFLSEQEKYPAHKELNEKITE